MTVFLRSALKAIPHLQQAKQCDPNSFFTGYFLAMINDINCGSSLAARVQYPSKSCSGPAWSLPRFDQSLQGRKDLLEGQITRRTEENQRVGMCLTHSCSLLTGMCSSLAVTTFRPGKRYSHQNVYGSNVKNVLISSEGNFWTRQERPVSNYGESTERTSQKTPENLNYVSRCRLQSCT
jgi:hypothetical protein